MEDLTLKKLQSIELNILLEVDRICKKHNITYFLVAGTLLGAIRHKGFIPWDDDIDISMPIKDYRRFCKVAKKELGNDYFLQTYNTDFSDRWFAKVRKNGTTCIEKGCEKVAFHQGCWIDIFPLIGIKQNDQWIKRLNKWATFGKKLIRKKYGSMISKNDYSKEKIVLRFIPLSLIRFIVGIIYKTIFKNYDKYEKCHYLWGDPEIRIKFDSNLFNDITSVDFEGYTFPAPKKWDEYLTIEYGDYMTPPPPEKRNGGSHTIVIMDVEKDYTEYINLETVK